MKRTRSARELRAIHSKGKGRPKPQPKPAPKAHRVGAYTLHSRQVRMKNGGRQTIYFYARGASPSGQPATLPPGYMTVTSRNGVPFIARDDRRQKEHLARLAGGRLA